MISRVFVPIYSVTMTFAPENLSPLLFPNSTSINYPFSFDETALDLLSVVSVFVSHLRFSEKVLSRITQLPCLFFTYTDRVPLMSLLASTVVFLHRVHTETVGDVSQTYNKIYFVPRYLHKINPFCCCRQLYYSQTTLLVT